MQTRTTSSMLIALLLASFAFFPTAQAVITDPEGYFPGWNTAEGQSALFSLTTGLYNTALGGQALYKNTTGNSNTAVGLNALFSNATAFGNTAMGAAALYYNTTGVQNTATGYAALRSNRNGDNNTATGYQALYFNTIGNQNTANGWRALHNNKEGGGNTAYGYAALYNSNTLDGRNTAIGSTALYSATTGTQNTAIGYAAHYSGFGSNNTAIGSEAMYNSDFGVDNTGIGSQALYNNRGTGNTAIGNAALYNNGSNGNFNTAIGTYALHNNTTGRDNAALGHNAASGITTAHNVICIGAGVGGLNVNNSCYIGSIFGQTSVIGVPVFINSNNKLGTSTSSNRFKKEIKPMERASEALYRLKPVTFRYKKEIDATGTSQFGLVAEEVEKVNRDLVVRDEEGKPYSVRYEQVNAMLLNEFLKEHRKGQEQDAIIAELKSTVAQQRKEMETVFARLKEQDSKLQKVSAQLAAAAASRVGPEVSTAARQKVADN